MTEHGTDVAIKLDVGRAEPDEVEELSRLLLDELREADVDAELVDAGDAPEGTKGFGLLAVGSLVVKIVSGKALKNALDVLRAWLARDANRSAKVVVGGNSIELSGLTADQQQQLIDEWVRSRARVSDDG
jgi:hypothetical protein